MNLELGPSFCNHRLLCLPKRITSFHARWNPTGLLRLVEHQGLSLIFCFLTESAILPD